MCSLSLASLFVYTFIENYSPCLKELKYEHLVYPLEIQYSIYYEIWTQNINIIKVKKKALRRLQMKNLKNTQKEFPVQGH